jgi:mono/diheme cytochrome c family protein
MFKKILKWTLLSILVLVALLLVSAQFLYKKTYEAPYPDIHASTDSATIARGKYLVMGPAHCPNCHGHQELRLQLTGKKFLKVVGSDIPRKFSPQYHT